MGKENVDGVELLEVEVVLVGLLVVEEDDDANSAHVVEMALSPCSRYESQEESVKHFSRTGSKVLQ